LIRSHVDVENAAMLKDLAFRFKAKGNYIVALGSVMDGKPGLALLIPEDLVKEKELNAGIIIRDAAKAIRGGGGGQNFFATAGGSFSDGLDAALDEIKKQINDKM
jgi:alanyl-tRNA synthetase